MGVPTYVNPRDQLHQELAKLRRELEDAHATIEELRERFEPVGIFFPREWRLTGKETRIMNMLYHSGGLLAKHNILSGMYDNDVDEPDIKIVDVFVCKMRKKLARYGITIETVWGQGYRLTPASQAEVGLARAAAGADVPYVSSLPPAQHPLHNSGRWHPPTPEEVEARKRAGEGIRKTREKLGLSRGQLADRVGCGTTYTWVIESGGASAKATARAQEVLRDWNN